jgi:hypothetical protein
VLDPNCGNKLQPLKAERTESSDESKPAGGRAQDAGDSGQGGGWLQTSYDAMSTSPVPKIESRSCGKTIAARALMLPLLGGLLKFYYREAA